ncbi:MAG: VanZ family protein [Clostridiales bacterium]|nr:VanZ family protein [Clostridiales bacterium]
MTRDRRFLVLFSVIAVLLTGFIFHNSMQDADASHAQSACVLRLLSSVLPGLTEHAVRKLAHFLEYAALGWDLLALSVFVRRCFPRRLLPLAALFPVIPVIDECIQLFSDGRTAAFTDVCLDWSGMGCGALVCLMMIRIIQRG